MVSAVDIVQTANVVHIARTCQVAGSVAVLYDHVLTFDQEVDHVWDHPCSFGSINYLLVRYLGDALAILNVIAFLGQKVQTLQVRSSLRVGLVRSSLVTIRNKFTDASTSTTLHSCKIYFFAQSWLGVLVLFMIQLMLQVRLYALYRGSRIILVLMMLGYVCEIAATSIIIALVEADSQITNELLPGLYICADLKGPSFYQLYLLWLPAIAYDGALCLLALWRAVECWMTGRRLGWTDWGRIQDGLVTGNVSYFFCLILACIVSIVMGQRLGIQWSAVAEVYPAALEAIVGCRLILNLRSLLVENADKKWCENVGSDAPWVVRRHPLSTIPA